MNTKQRRTIRHRLLPVLTGLAAMQLLPQLVFAQPTHTPQIIAVTIDAKDKGAAVKEVDLRPNTPTELGFDLRNLAGEILGGVSLRIVQVVEGKDDQVIAEATIPKLDPIAETAKVGHVVQVFEKTNKVKKESSEKLALSGT